jgi:hypothetical protein
MRINDRIGGVNWGDRIGGVNWGDRIGGVNRGERRSPLRGCSYCVINWRSGFSTISNVTWICNRSQTS